MLQITPVGRPGQAPPGIVGRLGQAPRGGLQGAWVRRHEGGRGAPGSGATRGVVGRLGQAPRAGIVPYGRGQAPREGAQVLAAGLSWS